MRCDEQLNRVYVLIFFELLKCEWLKLLYYLSVTQTNQQWVKFFVVLWFQVYW